MTQNEHFAKPIALPKWPIFKIVLFLEYLVFFGAVFCTELLYCARRIDFCMFFGILMSILTQNEHFAKPIALPKWPIFKIVLFLEYLVFFGAVFCTELLYCARRIDFCMFFGILIFDPK